MEIADKGKSFYNHTKIPVDIKSRKNLIKKLIVNVGILGDMIWMWMIIN